MGTKRKILRNFLQQKQGLTSFDEHFPRRNFGLAKEVASLDRLSGGRFLFGIGGGWNAEEMEHHGTVYKTRFTKMGEQVRAMKEIWTKDVAEFHGEHVNFEPLWCWPKPAQQPHPPVLLGGERRYTP